MISQEKAIYVPYCTKRYYENITAKKLEIAVLALLSAFFSISPS